MHESLCNRSFRLTARKMYKGLTIGVIFLAATTLCFSTFHYMVIFWSFFVGVIISLIYLRPGYHVPNLLPSNVQRKGSKLKNKLKRGCSVCGKADCKRERREESLEALRPWAGIAVTEREDRAVQEFLELLIERHVWNWYRKLSKDEAFINELKISLRYALSVLYRRVNKIDLPEVIVKKLIKVAIQHLHVILRARDQGNKTQDEILAFYGSRLHKAARCRRSELDYVRALCDNLLPLLLPSQMFESSIMKSFLREVLAANVVMPGLDAITDPDKVNYLLLIFFSETPPAEADQPPAPKVSFLEQFAPPDILLSESSVLQVELPEILQTQDMLYQFMTFLKTQSAVHILQFCLTVEDFNRRCLAQEQSPEQQKKLHKEAKEIYETYCLPESINFIHFDNEIIKELGDIAKGSWEDVCRLRTSAPMFRAYEHAYNLLEQLYCPLFYHSDIYYRMICGDRMLDKESNAVERDYQQKSSDQFSSVRQFGSKLMGVFKGGDSSSLNGDGYGDEPDEDAEDNDRTSLIDLEEDNEGRQDILLSRDLSTWRVSVDSVEQRRDDEGGEKYYTFVISIRRVNIQSDDELPPEWTMRRRYTEFYVLESKLCEFHGSLSPAHLPPKKLFSRNWDFLNSKRRELERFLQALISKPVLRRSELLYDFLSPFHDGSVSRFGSRFLPEVRLGRFFKRVPTKIIKEKGQHLDTLLQSLINSCEASKPKPGKYEMPCEDPVVQMDQKIHNALYPDSDWQIDPFEVSLTTNSSRPEIPLDGVYDYILYLAKRVFQVEDWIFQLMVAMKIVVHNTLEPYVARLLQSKIDTYREEHHVVDLIQTFRDLIFFNEDEPRTDEEKMERQEEALQEWIDFLPGLFTKLIGCEKHISGCRQIFDVLQIPKLNKQLGFMLLDVFLLELFPELSEK